MPNGEIAGLNMPSDEEPPSAVEAPQAAVDSSLGSERRLWFDYIGRLNDRHLDSTRRSGATTWVLLGLVAALLYRFVPRLPGFLSIPGNLKQSLVIFLLELDIAYYFLSAFFLLIWYATGGIERRLLPEPQKRVGLVNFWIVVAVSVSVVLAHFYVATKFMKSMTFTRATFWGLGIWLGANLLFAIRKEVRTVRQARKHKIPAPRFTIALLEPNYESLVGAFLLLGIGTITVVTLLLYLRELYFASVVWFAPLSAASLSLTVCAVFAILLSRGLDLTRAATHESLERAIVLEGLEPSAIKSRFMKQLLGPSLSDWLTSLMETVDESENRLAELSDSGWRRVKEIREIDPKNTSERKGRAIKLLQELQAGMEQNREVLRRYQFQINEFSNLYPRSDELKKYLEEWKSRRQSFMTRAESTRDLVQEIVAFIQSEIP